MTDTELLVDALEKFVLEVVHKTRLPQGVTRGTYDSSKASLIAVLGKALELPPPAKINAANPTTQGKSEIKK